jgi:hypothetical protein
MTTEPAPAATAPYWWRRLSADPAHGYVADQRIALCGYDSTPHLIRLAHDGPRCRACQEAAKAGVARQPTKEERQAADEAHAMERLREDLRLVFELNPELRPFRSGATWHVETFQGDGQLDGLDIATISIVALDGYPAAWHPGQGDLTIEAALRHAEVGAYAVQVEWNGGEEAGMVGEGWVIVAGLRGIAQRLVAVSREYEAGS